MELLFCEKWKQNTHTHTETIAHHTNSRNFSNLLSKNSLRFVWMRKKTKTFKHMDLSRFLVSHFLLHAFDLLSFYFEVSCPHSFEWIIWTNFIGKFVIVTLSTMCGGYTPLCHLNIFCIKHFCSQFLADFCSCCIASFQSIRIIRFCE